MLEGWKVGRLEGCNVGRLEGWKVTGYLYRFNNDLMTECPDHKGVKIKATPKRVAFIFNEPI
jgi:hypothetical protein